MAAGPSSVTTCPYFLVGVAGFEPTAPRSQSECATKLRHTPGADGGQVYGDGPLLAQRV